MFICYEQALAFMQSTAHLGSVPGLSRLENLLSALQHPERKLSYIHVAGSNGKGSTCAMIASLLQQAGYRVGLFTSPFLSDLREQIRINGEKISKQAYTRLAGRIADLKWPAEQLPTEFELTVALAFLYFCEQQCDFVVLETGMGGTLDATNVIPPPRVAVITRIGMDHTQFLGSTLSEISAHKAGIVKRGCMVVCYPQQDEAWHVVKKVCAEQDVPCIVPQLPALQIQSSSLEGQTFVYQGQGPYQLSLLGKHQAVNAIMALETIQCLRRQGVHIPPAAIQAGLANVQWPARLEILHRQPLFVLDGGHNLQCIQTVVQTLDTLIPNGSFVCLFGVMGDKDYPAMLQTLTPYVSHFVGVQPNNSRALPLDALGQAFAQTHRPYTLCTSIPQGVETALCLAQAHGVPVCALGSLYMAGEIRGAVHSLVGKQTPVNR